MKFCESFDLAMAASVIDVLIIVDQIWHAVDLTN